MENIENAYWYFPEENSVSDKLVDSFTDSKFSIDKWTSFAREIIQNSLDVPDEENGKKKTVRVEFHFDKLSLNQIPGGTRLKNILIKAREKATNPQTISAYSHGLEVLSKEQIPCLKVSDYNTLGVKEGRDNEWGALVYDEGKSKKKRPGSAGSHGVGKKAPFIISTVNTVFYSTNTKEGALLSQGKCSLVNWDDENGKTRSPVGWFGIVDEKNDDRRNRVQPIDNNTMKNIIDPYFVRNKEENGTDVIIIGVNIDDEQQIKEKMINAILENFFVAIDQKLLEVNILGEEICQDNLDRIIDKFFKDNRNKSLKKDTEIANIKYGNLTNYYDVYKCQTPYIINLVIDNINYGYIELYFGLKNDKGRKYYCIFREHGMKIKDVSLTTDQEYSAVAVIKNPKGGTLEENDQINPRLSKVENAAHDNFIINDPEVPCDQITERLVRLINEEINTYILKQTEIVATDETPLEGLDEMLAIQGKISTKIRRSSPKIIKKKNVIKRRGKAKKALDYDEGVSNIGGLKVKKAKKDHKGANKPAKPGEDFEGTLFTNFLISPYFLHIQDEYLLVIISNENIDKANIRISPISVDGTLAPIENILVDAYDDSQKYSVNGNIIRNVKLKSSTKKIIKFKLKNNINYSLDCEVRVGDSDE